MDCSLLFYQVPLSPTGPVPALPAIYIYLSYPQATNLATAAHHPASFLACFLDLPTPPPTHGHIYKWAAFCGVQPSHTQLASSVFPISLSHCRWGPLSVSRQVSPRSACHIYLSSYIYSYGVKCSFTGHTSVLLLLLVSYHNLIFQHP